MKDLLVLDADRPVTNVIEDKYGFKGIAKNLSFSVIKSINSGGMVIGLEGPWGSGKTTLLNFMKDEIVKNSPDDLHIITLSPWLDGDSQDLTLTLINPIAEILDKDDLSSSSSRKRWFFNVKNKSFSIGSKLRYYGVKTARTMSVFSKASDIILPGSGIVADTIGKGANLIGEKGRELTTIELKENISKQMKDFGGGFLVVLDDLDRIEPKQAVEVVRLVRSVADFPRITYLMCYDRYILSQALEKGLEVSSGSLYLQKIVQLTFSMPLPEPFDLREEFLNSAIKIYNEVEGGEISEDIFKELKRAVDREGEGLRTPREVKLVLNSIKFLYPSVKEYVYYPDLCRINLLKTIKPELYFWVEEYLSLWSIIITSKANVSSIERYEMGRRLRDIYPVAEKHVSHPITKLGLYLPGVFFGKENKNMFFRSVSKKIIQDYISDKRLGSPVHYRYYFALSAPRTIIPEDDFIQALKKAGNNYKDFSKLLVAWISKSRASGGNFFDYIVDRFHLVLEDSSDVSSIELKGVMYGLIESADTLMYIYGDDRILDVSPSQKAYTLVCCMFKELDRRSERVNVDEFINLMVECSSTNWVMSTFLRGQCRVSGQVGDDQTTHGNNYILSEEELNVLKISFAKKIKAIKDSDILSFPDLSGYLYGWRDVYGRDEVVEWINDITKDNESFYVVLDSLKTWSVSDRVYYYLNRSAIEEFFEYSNVRERLNELSAQDDKAKELISSLRERK